MKTIPLTQGQEAIVDDWWYEYLMQWKWSAMWNKDTQSFYAVRKEGSPHRRKISMHRMVAKTPDGMECDHIHHLTLDNRESELRNVTRSQNSMNQRIRNDNSSGVAGVHIRKGRGKYAAYLDFEGKRVLYKEFKTLEEAISARREAEKRYFGEFANTNL